MGVVLLIGEHPSALSSYLISLSYNQEGIYSDNDEVFAERKKNKKVNE